MGSKQFCVAINGQSKDTVLKILKLRESGSTTTAPDNELVGISLSNGWYVLFADLIDILNVTASSQKLSKKAQIVTGYSDEDSMQCGSSFWQDGKCVWSIEHNYDKDDNSFKFTGQLPAFVEAIEKSLKNSAEANGFNGDYMLDLPSAIVEHVSGFTLASSPGHETTFHVLTTQEPKSSPNKKIIEIISEQFQNHGFAFNEQNEEFTRPASELLQIVQYQTKWYSKSSATVTFRVGVRCPLVEELYWQIRGDEGRTPRQQQKIRERSLTIETFCSLVTPKIAPHFPRFGPISLGTAVESKNTTGLKSLNSFLVRFVEPWFRQYPHIDSIFNDFMTEKGRKNTLGVFSFQKALTIAMSTRDEKKLSCLLGEISRQSELSDFAEHFFRDFYLKAVAIDPVFLPRYYAPDAEN